MDQGKKNPRNNLKYLFIYFKIYIFKYKLYIYFINIYFFYINKIYRNGNIL